MLSIELREGPVDPELAQLYPAMLARCTNRGFGRRRPFDADGVASEGDADGFVPMHHAEDFVARLPPGLGRLHRLAGVGHISITTRFGDILDAVSA